MISITVLTSGRQHDGPVFRVGSWVRDRLLMLDLRYFRYQLFDCIDRDGGHFISRLKENANPEITAILRQWRGRSVPLVGERLRDVIERLQRQVLDIEVEVAFRRRPYAGSQSGARRSLRLVGVRNEETGRYHLFCVTNIPPERLTAEQVAVIYTGRWQIELLFKEMKSHYGLEGVSSRKPHIVEALLYATPVTLVASRRLLRAVRVALRGRPHAVPEGRWGVIFAGAAGSILDLLLAPARLVRVLAKRTEWTLLHEAADPNLSRPSLLARVENGVLWCWPKPAPMNRQLRGRAEGDRLQAETQLLCEEIRIKDARMEQLEAH
jgi:hypothetical protein